MKKILLLMCMLVYITCFCANIHKKSHTVVLTFDTVKSNYDTIFFSTGASVITPQPILSFRLSADKKETVAPKKNVEIYPILDIVAVNHKYNPTSSVDFILHSGDSIGIHYVKEGAPFIEIKNRIVKKYDLNYDYFKRQRYPISEGMQTIEIVKNPSTYFYKKLIKGNKTISIPKILQEFYPKLLKELKDESIWLDSLFKSSQVSEKEYKFYKERNKYTLLNLNHRDNSIAHLDSLLKGYNDSIYRTDLYGFYKEYYYLVGVNYLNSIQPLLKNDKFTATYDFIENKKDEFGLLSQDLLELVLKNILQKSPIEQRQKYFNKFSNLVSDTSIISKLKSEYENLLNPDIAITNDLLLLSSQGEKITFDYLIRQCKGKIIYVDFWASWCAPCLEEMNYSKRLRDNKKFNDVVFIYLALNDKEERWKQKFENAHLRDYKHNYLILNSNDALFIKQNKINTLPRYMIFDKLGKLINKDAYRPSNNKIYKILLND
ncbi:TlpA disulfide reductase family protein [Hoylesella oralis]|uniref:TlpA family protein disulfide reductase n=1 Tax=Hoylesella oralis TaxID=28134 RepID=UPI0028E8FEBF|nr:TlpA disulfide reductase family protein [Hoylesella oralis]